MILYYFIGYLTRDRVSGGLRSFIFEEAAVKGYHGAELKPTGKEENACKTQE